MPLGLLDIEPTWKFLAVYLVVYLGGNLALSYLLSAVSARLERQRETVGSAAVGAGRLAEGDLPALSLLPGVAFQRDAFDGVPELLVAGALVEGWLAPVPEGGCVTDAGHEAPWLERFRQQLSPGTHPRTEVLAAARRAAEEMHPYLVRITQRSGFKQEPGIVRVLAAIFLVGELSLLSLPLVWASRRIADHGVPTSFGFLVWGLAMLPFLGFSWMLYGAVLDFDTTAPGRYFAWLCGALSNAPPPATREEARLLSLRLVASSGVGPVREIEPFRTWFAAAEGTAASANTVRQGVEVAADVTATLIDGVVEVIRARLL